MTETYTQGDVDALVREVRRERRRAEAVEKLHKALHDQYGELRRLLIDVAQYGITPCAREDYVRLTGDTTYGGTEEEEVRA